jgi:LacI family transcriptional regulator
MTGLDGKSARRPTMKDVAALAGVGLSTVSRVVNGRDDVRDDLVARVRDAVEVLGYRRDHTASTLRRADRVSASIGLVFDDVGNPFFSAVQRGVEDVARARGVLAFAGSSDQDPERERELADAFSARGVDGLIIVPANGDQSYLMRDRQAGLAIVFVDRPPRLIDADAVVSDNAGGTHAAVSHLIAAGHRRIGFLGDRRQIYTAVERLRGYRHALADHDIPCDERALRLDLNDSASGHDAARELLGGPDPPTALFAGQNLISVGAIHALRSMGLQHTVALVGFDDIVLGDALEPGITVVAQDPTGLGRAAARLLFARLDGYRSSPQRVVVPTRLIQRGSGELPPRAIGDRGPKTATAPRP